MPSLKTLVLATTAATNAAISQVSPCGGDFSDVEAKVYPEILTVGDEAYLYLRYSAPYEVDDGSTTTTLTFNSVPYPDMDGKLCTDAPFLGWGEDDGEERSSEDTEEEPLAANTAALESYFALGAVGCPITVGSHASNESFSIPNMAGRLKSKVQWLSQSGTLLLCLKFLLTIEDADAAAAAQANNTDV